MCQMDVYVFCSISRTRTTFLGRRVKLKEFKLLHAVLLINVSFKTMDQSQDPRGRASIESVCFILFDGNMLEEVFCTALFVAF